MKKKALLIGTPDYVTTFHAKKARLGQKERINAF